MIDLIEATSRQIKTMADGTLRLTVDIPPTSAQDAFKLFGAPDVPMVLARLNQDAASKSAQDGMIRQQSEVESTTSQTKIDNKKGGELARLAGMWCQDQKFWEWINESGCTDEIINEETAAGWVRRVCSVNSRSELDINENCGKFFHHLIRLPYSEWLRTNG